MGIYCREAGECGQFMSTGTVEIKKRDTSSATPHSKPPIDQTTKLDSNPIYILMDISIKHQGNILINLLS
jgi:hypothetical protein